MFNFTSLSLQICSYTLIIKNVGLKQLQQLAFKMSDISFDILEKLKCSKCLYYLSRAPIYLKENGTSICGRCFTLQTEENKDDNVSEKLYHEVAFEHLLKTYQFPCMYKNEGCQGQLPFSSLEKHENTCKFQPMKCLISSTESCDWSGAGAKFYDHCVDKHPAQVLQQHPFVFQHDVTKASVQSYVAKLCEILFLIHVKVCLTTQKIYHTVQCVSGRLKNANSKFLMTIERGNRKIVTKEDILPYSQTTICKKSSVVFGINSLIEILNGFNNTLFTIDLDDNLHLDTCIKCQRKYLNTNNNKYCATCGKTYIFCKNVTKGCNFSDIDNQLVIIHELSVCSYNVKHQCPFCKDMVENTMKNSLIDHIKSKHNSRIINENLFYSNFFSTFYSDFILISYVDSFNLLCICNKETWQIRLLSLDNRFRASDCIWTMFIKPGPNRLIIEKTLCYTDRIQVDATILHSSVKLSSNFMY